MVHPVQHGEITEISLSIYQCKTPNFHLSSLFPKVKASAGAPGLLNAVAHCDAAAEHVQDLRVEEGLLRELLLEDAAVVRHQADVELAAAPCEDGGGEGGQEALRGGEDRLSLRLEIALE